MYEEMNKILTAVRIVIDNGRLIFFRVFNGFVFIHDPGDYGRQQDGYQNKRKRKKIHGLVTGLRDQATLLISLALVTSYFGVQKTFVGTLA